MHEEMYPGQSERLHAYLDGELNSAEEDTLFRDLAGSQELRGEMRDLVAIRNAVTSDKQGMIPPLAVTTALFTGLGFSVPASATTMAPIPVPTTPTPPPVAGGPLQSWCGRHPCDPNSEIQIALLYHVMSITLEEG